MLLGLGMKNPAVNLRDLVILVADPNSYVRRVVHGILRGFGANKVLEVENSLGLFHALSGQKIDILLCDTRLPCRSIVLIAVAPNCGMSARP